MEGQGPMAEGCPVPAQKHRRLLNSVQESFSEVWPDSECGICPKGAGLPSRAAMGPLWTSQGLEHFWVSELVGYLDNDDQAGTSTVFYTPLAAQLCNKFHNKCQIFPRVLGFTLFSHVTQAEV